MPGEVGSGRTGHLTVLWGTASGERPALRNRQNLPASTASYWIVWLPLASSAPGSCVGRQCSGGSWGQEWSAPGFSCATPSGVPTPLPREEGANSGALGSPPCPSHGSLGQSPLPVRTSMCILWAVTIGVRCTCHPDSTGCVPSQGYFALSQLPAKVPGK